jgi:hypothetical protein
MRSRRPVVVRQEENIALPWLHHCILLRHYREGPGFIAVSASHHEAMQAIRIYRSGVANRPPDPLCVSLPASIGWNQMDAANAEKSRVTLRDALAGLQAGVLGALLMIGWLMLCSVSMRRSIWIVPNLFATIFYGPGAYQNQFLRSSWPGIALMLAIYGVGGLVWGVLCGVLRQAERRPPFLPLFGAIAGLLVYYIFFDLIWRHADPLIPLYAPDRQLQVAHVLWGIVLARAPLYSRRIAAVTTGVTVEPALQEAAEVRSGDIIL